MNDIILLEIFKQGEFFILLIELHFKHKTVH